MKTKFTFKPKVLLLTILCVGVLSTFSSALAQSATQEQQVIIYVPLMIGTRPHRAPTQNESNVIYLKFLQDMQDVTIEVYENNQISNLVSEDTVYNEEVISLSVKGKTGIKINIYSQGILIETLTV